MSDHRRRRRPGSREPEPGEPAGAERWIGYLDWCREDLIDGVLGLGPGERRRCTVASGWTPIEMLSHVLHMEQRWFVWGFLGEQVDQPWGDWTVSEPWTADDSDETRAGARWVVAEEVTAEQLAARLRTIGERTADVLRTHPLEARAAPGGRFDVDPPTLEWICFHVLAEYARHAGHLDIVAETLGASDH